MSGRKKLDTLCPLLAVFFAITTLSIGLYNYFLDVGPNKCEMTYMFEYPTYTKLDLPEPLRKRFSQYGLYAYSEGRYNARVRRGEFFGIPVLFLPGNGGSYRQVRSLGSVSLRKSEDVNLRIWFDYFSVDFNEELSGLVGNLLWKQTEFTEAVVKHILQSLYREERSIVLVGHSMGGVVARSVLANGFGDVVSLIYTQATPHRAPVIALDAETAAFYRTMEANERRIKLFKTPVVSVSGGRRDVIITDFLASLDGIEVAKGSLSASTSGIPWVWASTDHLCVVWCKQLILATVRSMFQLVDENTTRSLISNSQKRAQILYGHFLTPNLDPVKIRHIKKADEASISLPFWFLRDYGVTKKAKFYSSRVEFLRAHGQLLTVVTNILDGDLILVCPSDEMDVSMDCDSVAPSNLVLVGGRVKAFSLDLADYDSLQNVVVKLPPVRKRSEASSALLSLTTAGNDSLMHSCCSSNFPVEFGFHENILRIEMASFLTHFHAYVLNLVVDDDDGLCLDETIDHTVYVRLWIPWANDDIFYAYDCRVPEPTEEMVLLLSTPPMRLFNRNPLLTLYKTSKFKFHVNIRWSLYHSLGQYFRFNGVSLILYGYLSICLFSLSLGLCQHELEKPTVMWKVLGLTIVGAAFSKTFMSSIVILAFNLMEETEQARLVIDAIQLYYLGTWSVCIPSLNFLISGSVVISVALLFGQLNKIVKNILIWCSYLFKENHLVKNTFYFLGSSFFIISPVINVSLTHLMCYAWMCWRLKGQVEKFSFNMNAMSTLSRLFLFVLNFPSLFVLLKNLLETRFNMAYFVENIVSNLNTPHTCLGILMWTTLHFDSSDVEFIWASEGTKISALTLFFLIFFTTEHSLYRCYYYDLFLWFIAGFSCVFQYCFYAKKSYKSD